MNFNRENKNRLQKQSRNLAAQRTRLDRKADKNPAWSQLRFSFPEDPSRPC